MRTSELKDISQINIDMAQPLEKRQKQFIKQIKNPYKFTCNGVVVEVEFVGDSSMEDKIINNLIK